MTETPKFYIIKRPAGNCEILQIAQLEEQNPSIIEKWGPYDSPEDAIARRIGLIRAGKCQPQWRIAKNSEAFEFKIWAFSRNSSPECFFITEILHRFSI